MKSLLLRSRSVGLSAPSAPSVALRSPRLAGAVALVCLAAACASTPPQPAPPPSTTTTTEATAAPAAKSLFDRLGGKPAIEAVVDRFLQNVAADERIKHRFVFSDLSKLRGHLVDQVCAATGGPCKYAGGDMKSVHKNMRLTDDDFNALVGDLVEALDHFKVPAQEKNELLGALGGMRGDIVEVSTAE